MIKHFVVINCDSDHCNRYLEFKVTSLSEWRKLAREKKWQVLGGNSYCPNHKRRGLG